MDAGRNLAVLVEAAVRNTVLQLRGIDTYKEFIERHQRAMERERLSHLAISLIGGGAGDPLAAAVVLVAHHIQR